MPNIWMLNLQFSNAVGKIGDGRFNPPPGVSNPPRPYFSYSQVWLQYNKSTEPLPSWAMSSLTPVDNADIVEADWDWVGLCTTTLETAVDDYMLIRIVSDFDPAGGSLRCAMVFGRGRLGPLPSHPNSRQSPLSDASYNAVPLVDTQAPNLTSWPPRSGGPGVPWIWCVGNLNGDPAVDPDEGAHYSFNVGAMFKPVNGNCLMYGFDPTVVVKGSAMKPKPRPRT